MRAWTAAVVLLAAGCQPNCDEPGIVCRLAGTGKTGFNREGLPPLESDLNLPSAVRRGPDGRIYVMDFNNMRLRVIDGDGSLRTVAGNGFHATADVSAPALDSPLENPIDFAFAPDGTVVFVSYHDPRVLRITPDGRLEVLAGSGVFAVRGNEGDYGDALLADFNQLDGIAITADGAIYVSDSKTNRVRVIRDGIVYPVAGNGADAYTGDGGPATEASLNWPTALELEADGSLLVADTLNHVIRRITHDGIITTVAGDGTAGFAGDGGPATEARLSQPNGLAVAPDGTIYVADRGNFRVRRIRGGIIETIAGIGEEGLSGDGGHAASARFGYLARIALDGDVLLVADQSNGCARRITLP
ncbi:MAG TPA: hypothetical protein VIL20_20670 [Sandaracinaceae bacterium]